MPLGIPSSCVARFLADSVVRARAAEATAVLTKSDFSKTLRHLRTHAGENALDDYVLWNTTLLYWLAAQRPVAEVEKSYWRALNEAQRAFSERAR